MILTVSLLFLSVSCQKEAIELNADSAQQGFLSDITAITDLPAEPRNASGTCTVLQTVTANGNFTASDGGLVRFNLSGNLTPNGVRGSFLIRDDYGTVRGKSVNLTLLRRGNTAAVSLEVTSSTHPGFAVGQVFPFRVSDGGTSGENDTAIGYDLNAGNVRIVVKEEDCGYSFVD